MEPMAYAEPGGIASAAEYNKVVDNVNLLGRGALYRRYADVAQSIPPPSEAAWTRLRFQGLSSSSSHVTVNAAADTFTIVTPGSYALSASVRFPGGGGGVRHIRISSSLDWNVVYAGNSIPDGPENMSVSVPGDRPFAVGDTLSVWVRQTTAASLNTAPVGEAINISIRYCGES